MTVHYPILIQPGPGGGGRPLTPQVLSVKEEVFCYENISGPGLLTDPRTPSDSASPRPGAPGRARHKRTVRQVACGCPSSAHSSAQGPQLCGVWASAGIRADSAVYPVPSTLASSPQGLLSPPCPGPPDLEKPLGVLRAGAPSGAGMVVLGDTGLYPLGWAPGWTGRRKSQRCVHDHLYSQHWPFPPLPMRPGHHPTPCTRAASSPVPPPAP